LLAELVRIAEKLGISSAKGLVDSHLGVIEDSTDSGVNFKSRLAAYCEPTPIAWSGRIARSEEAQESQDRVVTTIVFFQTMML
jgi:hypothetical protein